MAVLIGTETWDREETKRWLFPKEERKHGCPSAGDKTMAAPRVKGTNQWLFPVEGRKQNDGGSQGYRDETMGGTYQVHVRYKVSEHEKCHGCCVYTKRFILPYWKVKERSWWTLNFKQLFKWRTKRLVSQCHYQQQQCYSTEYTQRDGQAVTLKDVLEDWAEC